MKPSEIFDIMDLTHEATKNGNVFNPLFTGPPGVGKSFIVQQWAKARGIPLIDFRIAYNEAPDMKGFPQATVKDGREVTVHFTPEVFPTDGEGVFLFEEPNRGNISIMNCLMQVLTDRKIDKYELPPGWMVVACINPDGGDYDTNTMDPALKNRFVEFNVNYDKASFLDYMKATKFDESIINFIEAGLWQFSSPEDIGTVPGSKYISPRTWEQVKSVLSVGKNCDALNKHELTVFEAILGPNIAKDFYNFRHNESPVMYNDLTKHKKASLNKLAKFSDPDNYKNGMISLTVRDIVENNEISDSLLTEVLAVIPIDQGRGLLHELEFKRKDKTLFERVVETNKTLTERFRSTAKMGK